MFYIIIFYNKFALFIIKNIKNLFIQKKNNKI